MIKSKLLMQIGPRLRSTPERPCKLADHPQTAVHSSRAHHQMSHHSDGPRRATTLHILCSRARPGHALRPGCPAGLSRSHGRALKLLDALWRELVGSASGHRGRGRRGGGRSGSQAADRAASRPSRGMPTDERTRGSHRPTRLQRRADLESRATRGGDRSGTRCAGA